MLPCIEYSNINIEFCIIKIIIVVKFRYKNLRNIRRQFQTWSTSYSHIFIQSIFKRNCVLGVEIIN